MPIIEKFARSFFGFIISHPKIVLVSFLLAAGILGSQSRHFQINASSDTLLMKDDRNYIQTQLMNRQFSPEEFLLVAYKPKKNPVLSEHTFDDLKTLSEKFLQLDRVESVRSILNVPVMSKLNDTSSSATYLSESTMENHDYSIDEIKKSFDGHPIFEDLLINKDQTATAIQVLFKKNEKLDRIHNKILDLQQKILTRELSHEDRKKLSQLKKKVEPLERKLDQIRSSEIKTIRRIVADYQDDAEIYIGGIHVLAYQLIRIIKNDLLVFGSAIAIMICLILFILFRKLRWIVIPAICCACSVLLTLGLFGLLGFQATVISSSFISLQLILTLAIVIHLIVQYREYNLNHPTWEQTKLVTETVLRKAGPCFYAGLTNLVGFASLLFSNIRPVIDFGWMMSMAMFFSIGVSLILFPAMMAMFAKAPVKEELKISRCILFFFTRLTLKHTVFISLVSLGILIASIPCLFLLDVENSFINYFRSSTQVHKELTFIDQELGGSTPLDIVYTIPNAEKKKDLLMTADNVHTLQRIQQALKQHKAMGKILSVVNLTELAKAINDNRPLTEYELTALYWTMEDDLSSNLLGSFFSPENAQVRFNVRIKDTTKDLNRAQLISDIQHDMKEIGISDNQYMLTNLFVLYHNILQQLFQSQILTLGIAFGVLALSMLIIFRSIKLAIIGIIPNVLSTLMVLGVMGWLGIPLDLMTIMIAAIAMGITVDDTIHYIHRYLEELRDGSEEQAIERSHASVAYALLYTSLIVILGFSLLAFSDFIPSVLFGLLTGLAMAMAFIFDLTILPALLKKFVKRAS